MDCRQLPGSHPTGPGGASQQTPAKSGAFFLGKNDHVHRQAMVYLTFDDRTGSLESRDDADHTIKLPAVSD